MHAVVFEGNEQVSVQNVPDPVISAADSALVEAGQLDLGDVFTHRLPLSQAPAAYDILANRKHGVFKVLLDAQTSGHGRDADPARTEGVVV